MKLKTVLMLIVILIFTALVGANVYDWYKQDNFKTEHNKEKIK